MLIRVQRTDHPDVTELVASHHCVLRFRERQNVRTPGQAAVAAPLRTALEEAELTRWRPSWVNTDEEPVLWAVAGDLAFPLHPTAQSGRWLAVTCMVRSQR